jgi:hypothetical protein
LADKQVVAWAAASSITSWSKALLGFFGKLPASGLLVTPHFGQGPTWQRLFPQTKWTDCIVSTVCWQAGCLFGLMPGCSLGQEAICGKALCAVLGPSGVGALQISAPHQKVRPASSHKRATSLPPHKPADVVSPACPFQVGKNFAFWLRFRAGIEPISTATSWQAKQQADVELTCAHSFALIWEAVGWGMKGPAHKLEDYMACRECHVHVLPHRLVSGHMWAAQQMWLCYCSIESHLICGVVHLHLYVPGGYPWWFNTILGL